MKIEITIGDGRSNPKVLKNLDNTYCVVGEIKRKTIRYNRALWVKLFDNKNIPKDGKGLLIGPTDKLTVG